MKSTIIAGLAALTMGACNLPEYKGAGQYSCEKFGDRISAKEGNNVASKQLSCTTDIIIRYTTNIGLEEALKAIDACEKAFAPKAEKEEK